MVVLVELILFDMSALKYRLRDGTLSVLAPHVGELCSYPLDPADSRREAVFRALDHLLGSVELPSSNGPWYRAALYNPITYQIAVGPVPGTEVYGDGRPVVVPGYGSLISIGNFDGSTHLDVAGRVLPSCTISTRETQAALAAH